MNSSRASSFNFAIFGILSAFSRTSEREGGIGLLEGLKSWDPASVGPFKLLGVLGNGGFGRVYLGQAQNGQRVAVKVIKPDLAEDPEFRARFGREVDAARKVGGKFTARVVDADTTARNSGWRPSTFPAPRSGRR